MEGLLGQVHFEQPFEEDEIHGLTEIGGYFEAEGKLLQKTLTRQKWLNG